MGDLSHEDMAERLNELERHLSLQRQENEELAERFNRATREHRAQFAFVIFLFLAGAFSTLAGLKYAARSQYVEARRFTLRDEDGNSRATLYITPKGDPMLSFNNRDNKGILQISASNDNSAGLNIFDKDSKTRLKIVSTSNDESGLIFYDAEGRMRIEIGLRKDSSVGLTLYDGEGRKRTDFGLGSNNWTGLGFFDQRGSLRSDYGISPDGSGNLRIYSREGKPLLQIPPPRD